MTVPRPDFYGESAAQSIKGDHHGTYAKAAVALVFALLEIGAAIDRHRVAVEDAAANMEARR